MLKSAIYPGAFDPFTTGHLDIVKKSSGLFDKVYIIQASNHSKTRTYPAEEMKTAIEQTLIEQGITNCEVVIFDGLVAKFAKDNKIGYMIRGLRNNMDYNYEENLAEINKLINPDLQYVYFRAENVAVSSSMVKELHSYGQDVSKYVSRPVMEIMKNHAG